MKRLLEVLRTTSWVCLAVAAFSFPVAAADDAEPSFDHTATRFVLTGAHEGVPCEGCHKMGVFRGTPTQCSFCHDGSGMRAESGKPLSHIQSTNRCEDCHVTFSWSEVHFDHADVSSNCQACHNGVQAKGKPMDHVTTTANCDACHNTFNWNGVRFDHSGITEPCSNCHNGMQAQGKPNGHVVTTLECDACHSTRAWRPATFDHTGVTQPCSTCHNGMQAQGKPNGHFMTSRECDYCHNTSAWVPSTFRHMSPNYPGDHRQALTCKDCHGGNSETVTWTSPTYAGSCAGCHANQYRQGEGRHTNLSTDRNCGQPTCHSVMDRSFGN